MPDAGKLVTFCQTLREIKNECRADWRRSRAIDIRGADLRYSMRPGGNKLAH